MKASTMTTKVLVVDDELDTLNLLKTLLEISGFEAITTLNSVDAMTLAEIENPDVALLDIMMPQLDGFELCKLMRQNPATKDLPIIFVTAYTALDLEERRQEAGADYVIHKPIDIDRLIKVVEETRTEKREDGASQPESSPSSTTTTTSKPDTPPPPPKPDTASAKKETPAATPKPDAASSQKETPTTTPKPDMASPKKETPAPQSNVESSQKTTPASSKQTQEAKPTDGKDPQDS